MELSFASSDLEKVCSDPDEARKKYGQACSKKLQSCIKVLESAANVSELPRLYGLHDLKGDRIGQKAFSLDKSVRLVFAPGMDGTPRKSDGGIDWQCVTIVSIEYIGNYHD